MIKLIASDLDGTIIDNEHSIPEDNMKAIGELQKSKTNFAICTGKTYSITKDFCKNLHANYGIFGNGSQIIDLTTGEVIAKKLLSLDEIKLCLSVAKKYNLHVHAYTENSIITENPLYMDLRNSILFPSKIQVQKINNIFEFINKERPVILKLVLSSASSLSKVKEDLEIITNLTITHITKTGKYKDKIIDKEYEYLDVSPLNVTKGYALEVLSNYLNLKKEEVLSIGDNINDIDMFKTSGISVAINNAYDEVKQVASYTTTNSVENAGFAEAIYKFISSNDILNHSSLY